MEEEKGEKLNDAAASYLRKKYQKDNYTYTEILHFRDELEKKYGKKIIPELKGKLDGIAIRVPTAVVSILDLIVEVEKKTNKEEVNKAFEEAAGERELEGILRTEKEPLVSTDYIGNSYSAIVDLSQTMVNENLIKVLAWYDNEWGYACRLAEFAEYVGKKL